MPLTFGVAGEVLHHQQIPGLRIFLKIPTNNGFNDGFTLFEHLFVAITSSSNLPRASVFHMNHLLIY